MGSKISPYSIPLLYKKIFTSALSGELTVKSGTVERTLYFVDGQLIFARSNVVAERLGEILFNTGKISYTQYLSIDELVAAATQDDLIGKILFQKKVAGSREIYLALLYQGRINGLAAFLMNSGEWSFSKKLPDIPDNSRFPIELPGLMAEGVHKLEDFSYFKRNYSKKIPQIATDIPDPLSPFISKMEMEFYCKLERFQEVTNREIIPALLMEDDEYWAKIIFFFLLDLVRFVERKVEVNPPKDDPIIKEIDRLYEQLNVRQMDYYQLLAVTRDAPAERIKEAYFAASRKYHPDRVPGATNSEIKQKANYIFAELNDAFEVLSDELKREKYEAGGRQEQMDDEFSKLNMVKRAKNRYIQGKTLYRTGKFWEAVNALKESVRLDDSKAAYFYTLGMCQSEIPTLRKEAEENLKKAAQLEPMNSDPVYALGLLYKKENLKQMAERYFRKALEINLDHTKTGKILQEMDTKTFKKKDIFSFFTSKK